MFSSFSIVELLFVYILPPTSQKVKRKKNCSRIVNNVTTYETREEAINKDNLSPNRHAKVTNTRYYLKKGCCVSAGPTQPLTKTPGATNCNREDVHYEKSFSNSVGFMFLVLQLTGKGGLESGTRHANGKRPSLPDLHERVFKTAHRHGKNIGT